MTKRFLVPLSTDHIDFNTDNISESAEGRLWWNNEEGTLDLGMKNEVTQSIGMEFYMPPTKNNSGEVIPNGSFVMATGVQGDRITIAKAVTDGSVDPMYMIGVATHEIPIGSEDGLITTDGVVRQLNTNSYTVGDVLYPDPENPGGLTNIKPDAPAIRTAIAIVLRKDNNSGRIYVRMTNGSELGGTDSNVKFENLQNGDTLSYEDGIWKNAEPSGSSVVDSGPEIGGTYTNGKFFYNTTNGKLYFYFDNWQEVSTNTVNEFDGGNSSTTEFAFAFDGGNSFDTEFEPIYDGGSSL